METYERVDIRVNNVGGSLPNLTMQFPSIEIFNTELNFNLLPAVSMTFAVATTMKDNNYGRIINIGSLADRGNGYISGPGYGSAKAASRAFTRFSAKDLAPSNITVNLFAPGLIETNHVMLRFESLEPRLKLQRLSSISLGRPGKPEEVAAAFRFLASEDALFITGAILDVNGGAFLS